MIMITSSPSTLDSLPRQELISRHVLTPLYQNIEKKYKNMNELRLRA